MNSGRINTWKEDFISFLKMAGDVTSMLKFAEEKMVIY